MAMFAKRSFVGGHTRLEHDGGEDVLAVVLVGDADSGGFEHAGCVNRASSISRGAMFSPPLMMSSFDAAGDEVEAVAVAVTEIASAQPAIRC